MSGKNKRCSLCRCVGKIIVNTRLEKVNINKVMKNIFLGFYFQNSWDPSHLGRILLELLGNISFFKKCLAMISDCSEISKSCVTFHPREIVKFCHSTCNQYGHLGKKKFLLSPISGSICTFSMITS